MQKSALVLCAFLMCLWPCAVQGQATTEQVPVEVVATASEYVPRSTTIAHPGHSYTNCLGNTSYFADFTDYGSVGSVSGSANTNTNCSTTFTPPTETTLTTYRRVNYTIVAAKQALYLLACTQKWKPTRKGIFLAALAGAAAGAADSNGNGSEASTQAGASVSARDGKWSDCPAFVIGSRYTLSIRNTSDARLEGATGGKPSKLEYLSSAALPPAQPKSTQPAQTQIASTSATAKVQVTSSPSGADIYVDGKFYGSTPSDITLATGQHVVRITLGGKAWSRTMQVTPGKITIHAEMPH